jgi:hypothetical protein
MGYCFSINVVQFQGDRFDTKGKIFFASGTKICQNICFLLILLCLPILGGSMLLSLFLVIWLFWPGADVMITIFCDFFQFWAKKLAFFSKTNVMIQFLHNLASFWAPIFRKIFQRKYLKIIHRSYIKKWPFCSCEARAQWHVHPPQE